VYPFGGQTCVYAAARTFLDTLGFAFAEAFGLGSIVTFSIFPVNSNGNLYVKSMGDPASRPISNP